MFSLHYFICNYLYWHVGIFIIIIADSSVEVLKVFHVTGVLLALHIPVAFCGFMPDLIQNLADDGLAILLPLHGFVGLNFVITDYVPNKMRGGVRVMAFLSMLLACGGMIRLNMKGNPGVSGTVKHLWMKPVKLAE